MSEFIWYLQAGRAATTSRGYTPVLAPDEDRFVPGREYRKLESRTTKGEVICPTELRNRLTYSRTDPNRKLDLPMWHALARYLHKDMVAVMQDFDMGKTIFVPVEIAVDDGGCVNTEYFTFMTSNVKPTIDIAKSEPIGVGDVSRSALSTDKKIHPGVVALPAALSGPDIWIDPQVNSTW